MKPSRSVPDLIDDLLEKSYEEMVAARDQLAEIGDPAIPALLDALSRAGDGAQWIGQTLAKIGKPGLRALGNLLVNDSQLRAPGLRALWEFEARAVPQVPLLTRFLDDPDEEIRWRAAHALGRIGPRAKKTLNRLIQSCGDPSERVRSSTVFALERIGLPRDRAVPLFLRLFEDEGRTVRSYALDALRKLGPCVPEALRPLIGLAGDPDEGLRRNAIDALGDMGTQAAEALPVLENALSDSRLRLRAAHAIWKVAGRADLVVPVILDNIEAHNEETCDLVATVGPAAIAVLPRLLPLLASEDYDTLWAAVDAVAALGPGAADAIPALMRLLLHPSPLVAGGATKALASIGHASIPTLLGALDGGTPLSRELAIDALGQIGEPAAEAVPRLFEILQAEDMVLDPAWITIAIAGITPRTDFIPSLVYLLRNHRNSYLRFRAARALGKLGPAGRQALRGLKRALQDPDERVAEAARESIRRVEST